MGTKENKKIEKLVEKAMNNIQLESPSVDFTTNLMTEIEQQKIFNYTPLISKKSWLIICTLIIGVSAYIAIYGNLTKSKWMGYLEFDLNLNLVPELGFSNTTLYASIIVSVLFFVQIIILKNYFNNRFSI